MEQQEKTRDRDTSRKIEVFEPPENLDPLWIGVGCVIKVERSGTRGHEPYQSLSYYLCSLSPQSRRLVDGIRGHWLIENSLHWMKDVITEEDISPRFDSIKGAISEMSHNLAYILRFCT